MQTSKPAKRKFPFSGLQRRVRARKDEPEPEEVLDESSEAGSDEGDDNESASDDEDASPSASASDEDDHDDDAAGPSLDPSQISFGELAEAQASLKGSRRRHGESPSSSDSDSDAPSEEGDDDDGKPKKPKAVRGRSSKHAPAEQSSKFQVSRKREVVPVRRPSARDPRFGPVGGDPSNDPNSEEMARKKYAFLAEYRDSEMATLRSTIKKTKDPRAKEQLQRALASMQSRKQAQQRREQAERVVAEHRRRERELVAQGVKERPFYLKRAEQKERALVDRFAGMKKGQVDRAIERRRKKVAGKEKKAMPFERRRREEGS